MADFGSYKFTLDSTIWLLKTVCTNWLEASHNYSNGRFSFFLDLDDYLSKWSRSGRYLFYLVAESYSFLDIYLFNSWIIFFFDLVQSSRIIYLIINMSLLNDHTNIVLLFWGITLAVAALYMLVNVLLMWFFGPCNAFSI